MRRLRIRWPEMWGGPGHVPPDMAVPPVITMIEPALTHTGANWPPKVASTLTVPLEQTIGTGAVSALFGPVAVGTDRCEGPPKECCDAEQPPKQTTAAAINPRRAGFVIDGTVRLMGTTTQYSPSKFGPGSHGRHPLTPFRPNALTPSVSQRSKAVASNHLLAVVSTPSGFHTSAFE